MKKFISIIIITVLLISLLFSFSGCTLKVETTDNSVSASVDGDTTEKVDNIIDWIKERLSRIFKTDSNSENDSSSEQI